MPPAAALLARALLSLTLDLAAGARTELAVGQAPLAPGEDSEEAVAFEVVPVGALRLRQPTWSTRLRYRPRVFWRYPNVLELERPLLFHRADLVHDQRLARTATWTTRLEGEYGELDYTAASLLFDPVVATQVPDDVLRFQRVLAATGVELVLDRRQRLRLGPDAERSGPVDDETSVLPTQTRFGMHGEHSVVATRVDTFETTVDGDRYAFSNDQRLFTLRGVLGWQRRLGYRTEGELRAGALYASTLGTTDGDSDWYPTASAELRSVLWGTRGHRLRGRTGVEVLGFVDPILARVESRLGISAGLTLESGERWTAGADASLVTAANSSPREVDAAAGSAEAALILDETLLIFSTPVVYRANRGLGVEFGTRGSMRGPHWNHDEFMLNRLELWFYVALTAIAGTGDGGGVWAL